MFIKQIFVRSTKYYETAIEETLASITHLIQEENVDVNSMLTNNTTILFLAIKYGDDKVVDLLLSLGANPNLKTTDGETPLMNACERYFNNIKIQFIFNNLLIF